MLTRFATRDATNAHLIHWDPTIGSLIRSNKFATTIRAVLILSTLNMVSGAIVDQVCKQITTNRFGERHTRLFVYCKVHFTLCGFRVFMNALKKPLEVVRINTWCDAVAEVKNVTF